MTTLRLVAGLLKPDRGSATGTWLAVVSGVVIIAILPALVIPAKACPRESGAGTRARSRNGLPQLGASFSTRSALTDDPVTSYRLRCSVRRTAASARLVRNQINAACVKTGKPLEPLEQAALDFLDSLAYDPDIHLDMDLQLGDMQLCNNYSLAHLPRAPSDG